MFILSSIWFRSTCQIQKQVITLIGVLTPRGPDLHLVTQMYLKDPEEVFDPGLVQGVALVQDHDRDLGAEVDQEVDRRDQG